MYEAKELVNEIRYQLREEYAKAWLEDKDTIAMTIEYHDFILAAKLRVLGEGLEVESYPCRQIRMDLVPLVVLYKEQEAKLEALRVSIAKELSFSYGEYRCLEGEEGPRLHRCWRESFCSKQELGQAVGKALHELLEMWDSILIWAKI